MREYWTIVGPDGDGGREPIPPEDCINACVTGGMMVFADYGQCQLVCDYQKTTYGIDCEPCRLGEEVK
jgi:hypothetical protein